MDALEFLRLDTRMCDGYCEDCPVDIGNNGYDVGCITLKRIYPEEYIKIVERWSKEHPIKT